MDAVSTKQSELDTANSSFWDELCGSSLARSLGVVDASPASLARFDEWYFAYYPWLEQQIPFGTMTGKDVLEIGLGYGSVSQKVAEAGAQFCGLDIARGPVDMANHRLRQLDLPGQAQQGSILAAPFPDENFDHVIAIGCLHHTGSLQKALAECYRVLRRGGGLTLMVYNAYSYRRWYQTPATTFSYLVKEICGYRGAVDARAERERAAYDTDQSGRAAPHTDWTSVKSLRYLCRSFSSFSATRKNIDQEPPFSRSPRSRLLKTAVPSMAGLDIYASARK